MRLYRWLSEPMPAWFDRGTFIGISIGLTIGCIIGHST